MQCLSRAKACVIDTTLYGCSRAANYAKKGCGVLTGATAAVFIIDSYSSLNKMENDFYILEPKTSFMLTVAGVVLMALFHKSEQFVNQSIEARHNRVCESDVCARVPRKPTLAFSAALSDPELSDRSERSDNESDRSDHESGPGSSSARGRGSRRVTFSPGRGGLVQRTHSERGSPSVRGGGVGSASFRTMHRSMRGGINSF